MDGDNWWKYGLGSVAIGGAIGAITATPNRSLGKNLPGQNNNITTNPSGKLKYPSYKGSLTKDITLFNYQEFIANGCYTLPFQKIIEFGPLFRRLSFFAFNGNTYFDGSLFRKKRDIGDFSVTRNDMINAKGNAEFRFEGEAFMSGMPVRKQIRTQFKLTNGELTGFDHSVQNNFGPPNYGEVKVQAGVRATHLQYTMLIHSGWRP